MIFDSFIHHKPTQSHSVKMTTLAELTEFDVRLPSTLP